MMKEPWYGSFYPVTVAGHGFLKIDLAELIRANAAAAKIIQ